MSAGARVLLAGVYVFGILAFGSQLAPFGAGSELAVAASTLAAAALFRPVGAREDLQTVVSSTVQPAAVGICLVEGSGR